MSNAFVTGLPLPEPHDLVKAQDGLLKTWRSVNDWYGAVVYVEDRDRKEQLKLMGPHIKLGLRYLSFSLRNIWLEEGKPKDPASVYGPYLKVQQAVKAITEHPIVKPMYERGNKSTFGGAVACAQFAFDRLFRDFDEPGMPQPEGDAEIATLQQMRLWHGVWQNISRYHQYARDNKLEEDLGIKAKTIKVILERISEGIANVEACPEQGSELDEDMKEMPPRKKARLVLDAPAEAAAPSRDEVMQSLHFDQRESGILVWLERQIEDRGAGQPHAQDLVALAGGACINDNVVGPYLALLCASENEKQTPAGTATAPMWHAWPSSLFESIRRGSNLGRVWPPNGYPDAQMEDTPHHLFPIHLGDHWGLAHLSFGAGMWSLDWYSSLENYTRNFHDQWQLIEEQLRAQFGLLGEQPLPVNEPPQPMQDNILDCGVFVLCEARCLITGWPINTFQADIMPFMRKRICFELEHDAIASN